MNNMLYVGGFVVVVVVVPDTSMRTDAQNILIHIHNRICRTAQPPPYQRTAATGEIFGKSNRAYFLSMYVLWVGSAEGCEEGAAE